MKALWEKKLRKVCKQKYCRNKLISLLEDTDDCLDLLCEVTLADSEKIIDMKIIHNLQKIMRLLLNIVSLQK